MNVLQFFFSFAFNNHKNMPEVKLAYPPVAHFKTYTLPIVES